MSGTTVTIVLKENELPKVQYEYNGIKDTTHTDIVSLIEFLNGSVVDNTFEEIQLETPLIVSPSLPVGTVKYTKLASDTDVIFLAVEGRSHDVKYHTSEFKQVPYPNMVFCFGVRAGSLTKRFVAVYKDRFLRDDTELYHFPYSNVHKSTELCYFDYIKIEDMVQLQTFPHLWMNVPNNDHLYIQGVTNLTEKPLRELFQNSQNQKFDYDILRPLNKTFSQWTKSIIGE